jgi:hypothetical protein
MPHFSARFSILAITNFGNSGNLPHPHPVIFLASVANKTLRQINPGAALGWRSRGLAWPLGHRWATQSQSLGPSRPAEGHNQSKRVELIFFKRFFQRSTLLFGRRKIVDDLPAQSKCEIVHGLKSWACDRPRRDCQNRRQCQNCQFLISDYPRKPVPACRGSAVNFLKSVCIPMAISVNPSHPCLSVGGFNSSFSSFISVVSANQW